MAHYQSNNDLVSIIIPAYNLQGYISKCLRSLSCQTYRHLEILVIDDGSTDGTFEEASEFSSKDDRIRIIKQSNQGAASARNNGIRNCHGNYLMFVDGDDWLEDSTIELNLSLLKEKNADWVEFPIKRVNDAGILIENKEIGQHFIPEKTTVIERDSFIKLFFNKTLSGLVCGAIYKTESVANIHFPYGTYYEDSFYFLDVLATTNIGIVSNSGSYYYLNRPSSSQHKIVEGERLKSKATYNIKLIETINNFFPSNIPDLFETYDAIYFFYRLQYAKRIKDSKECFLKIREHTGIRNISFKNRMKIIIYELIGYKNIISVFKHISTNIDTLERVFSFKNKR